MKHSWLAAGLFVATGVPFAAHAQTLEAGKRLFEAKQYEEARAVFLPLADTNAEAAYYVGRIVGAENQRNAADWFGKAIKMNPNSSLYVEWYGRALADQASHASKFKLPFLARRVKGAFEKAIALDPDNIDAREDLIQYYVRAPGILGGSRQKARETAVEIKRRNAYRGGVDVADLCIEDKDFDCAERELLAMGAAYPDSAAVGSHLAKFHFARGAYYENAGKTDLARAEYSAAVQLDPKLEEARKALAALDASGG